jgi:hypothetical protein
MSTVLDPGLTLETFQVGRFNRDAVHAVRRVAGGAPAGRPLVLHGAAGAGKTHLLSAAGHLARSSRPEREVRLLSLSLGEWNEAGSPRAVPAPSAGSLLLLDGLDAVAGNPGAQLEMLRVLALAARAEAQVVIASREPPAALTGLDPRLRDRLADAEEVPVAAPPELRPGTAAPDEFGAFLSDISSSVAELVEAVPWEAPAEEAQEPEVERPTPDAPAAEPAAVSVDRWFLHPGRAALSWVGLPDRILEELG